MTTTDKGTEFNTPVGRIVWGHPLKPQQKKKDGQPVIDPQSGQPVMQWSFGVAFPKADFQAAIWPYLAAAAQAAFPTGIPRDFSYKYQDGDDTNPVWFNGKQSKAYAERPGYPGHYVLTVSTEFQAPNCVRYENGMYMQVAADGMKTGDFVMLGLNVKGHGGQSPGLYVNPLLVLLAYQGEALGGTFSADPTQIFGAAPQFGAMPAGAQPLGAPPAQVPGAMPMAQPQYQAPLAQPAQMPGAPNMAAPAPQMTTAPSPGAAPAHPGMMPAGTVPGQGGFTAMPNSAPAAAPAHMPPPAHDFVQNAGMPQAAPAPGGMPQMPGMMPPR